MSDTLYRSITIDYQVTFPDNDPKSLLSGNFPMITQYQVTFPDNDPKFLLSGNFPMIMQYQGTFTDNSRKRILSGKIFTDFFTDIR